MLRLTDKAFRYVPSFSTDLAKRFKEIIEEQRVNAASTAQKVVRPYIVAGVRAATFRPAAQ